MMRAAYEVAAWATAMSLIPIGVVVVDESPCLITGVGFGGRLSCPAVFAVGLILVSGGAVGTASLAIRRVGLFLRERRSMVKRPHTIAVEAAAWVTAASLVPMGLFLLTKFPCRLVCCGADSYISCPAEFILGFAMATSGTGGTGSLGIRRLALFLRGRRASAQEPQK